MPGRIWLFAALGLALLVVPWLLMRPDPRSIAGHRLEAAASLRRVDYTVRDGQRQAGPALIRATAGETLTLVVDSDRDDQLHLHGYELELHLSANQPGTLVLQVLRSGRFELELHRAGIELAVLEVEPR